MILLPIFYPSALQAVTNFITVIFIQLEFPKERSFLFMEFKAMVVGMNLHAGNLRKQATGCYF